MSRLIVMIFRSGLLMSLCGLMASCTLDVKITDTTSSPLNPEFTPELKMGLGKGICSGDSIYSLLPLDRDRLLMAGSFSKLGDCFGSGLIYDPIQSDFVGPEDELKTRVIGSIDKVISDGQGGWYVGGSIDSVGGVSQALVSRINADGTLNTSFKAFGNTSKSFGYASIKDMQLINGKLAVAGDFESQENPDGGLLTKDTGNSLNPSEPHGALFGPDQSANAVISDGGEGWYLGGAFTKYRGEPVQNLIRIDQMGNLVKSFDVKVLGSVQSLYLHSATNTIYMFGRIVAVNGMTRYNAAAVDATTGALTSWQPILGGGEDIEGFGVSASYGKIYLAGEFSIAAGPWEQQVVVLDMATGAQLETISVSHTSGDSYLFIESLIVDNDIAYLGGQFTTVKGVARNGAAAIDVATGAVTPWQPVNGGMIEVMVKSPNTPEIFMGGGFGVKAVNLTDGAVSFTPTSVINGSVTTLAVSTDALYFTGPFNKVGGQYRFKMGAISRSSGLVTAWDPARFEYPGGGYSYSTGQLLAVNSTSVFALPQEPTMGGARIQGLALLDANTGDYLPVDFKISAREVLALEASTDGNTLYVGGDFRSFMGQTRNGLAALNISDHTLSTWAPSPATGFLQKVNSLLVVGDKMYVGGYFLKMGANGLTKRHLAAVDIPSGNATAWDPQADDEVTQLELGDGEIFVGGGFSTIAGAPRAKVAAFDLTTHVLKTFEPAGFPGGSISDMLYFDHNLHIFSYGKAYTYSSSTGVQVSSPLDELTTVESTALSNGRLFLGGRGSGYKNTVDFNSFAIFNLQSRAFESIPWSLPPGEANESGYLNDDVIYLSGWFQDAVLGEDYGLIMINLKTSEVIKVETDGPVKGAIEHLDTVYFFGDFSQVDGQDRAGAAAVNILDGALTNWNPSPDDEVTALAVHGGMIFIGGYFSSVGGQSHSAIARVDATNGNADSWDLAIDGGVEQILFDNDILHLSGSIYEALGKPALDSVSIDMNSTSVLYTVPGIRANWTPYFYLTKSYFIAETGPNTYDVISRSSQETLSFPILSEVTGDSYLYRVYEKDGFIFLLGQFFTGDAGVSEVRVIRQSDGKIRY